MEVERGKQLVVQEAGDKGQRGMWIKAERREARKPCEYGMEKERQETEVEGKRQNNIYKL